MSDKIKINEKDLPKERNPGVVPCILRKKGAHPDKKKVLNKKKCREKIKDEEK